MAIRKIPAEYAQTDTNQFVGEVGKIFYELPTTPGTSPTLMYSDGVTVGGIPVSTQQMVSVLDFGADPAGATSSLISIQQAISSLPVTGGTVYFPAGTYNIGSGTSGIIIASTISHSVKLLGDGGTSSIIKYTGSGDAILFSNANGASILCGIDGLTIDCTTASPSANALHISGVWRSRFKDYYLKGAGGSVSTGTGLLLDNTASGTFDIKNYNPYIVGFGTNVKCIGGNLSSAGVTNFTMIGGYVSGGNINFSFSYSLDIGIFGTQCELAIQDGIVLNNITNFTWLGGAIEASGRYGFNFGSNVGAVLVNAGMFNNVSNDFNGSPSNMQYIGSQGVNLFGMLMRINNTQGGQGFLSFFNNGISDARLGVIQTGGTNGFSLFNGQSSNAEMISFDTQHGLLNLLSSTGVARLYNGAELNFYQSGSNTRFLAGSGSPQGVQIANPGSMYLNTNGGTSNTLWVKETGVGTNTGWAAK